MSSSESRRHEVTEQMLYTVLRKNVPDQYSGDWKSIICMTHCLITSTKK